MNDVVAERATGLTRMLSPCLHPLSHHLFFFFFLVDCIEDITMGQQCPLVFLGLGRCLLYLNCVHCIKDMNDFYMVNIATFLFYAW
jgi:hypothetical protein